MTPAKAGELDVSANREAWLRTAVEGMTPWLAEIDGVEVPPIRVSVGWPATGGLANRRRTVGECWKRSCSEDGVNQIFISPVRGHVQTIEVLATLLHEMIHAVDDCESGHRKRFIRIGRAVGFEPKWTQSSNYSEELGERFKGLLERIGPIPSAALTGTPKGSGKPKQEARMLKVVCPDCGYTVRTTRKWLDVGTPTCPCGQTMEEEA